MVDTAAIRAAHAAGLAHSVVEYGPVASLEEAADKRGVAVHDVMKSLVVRIGPDEFAMVIVPGDRVIDWPKLRAVLGMSRMALATEDEAFDVTGYRRGAITPLGSRRDLPVILDTTAVGEISLGGGTHGVSIHVDAVELVDHLGAQVADVTKPAP
jgi:Cys-tRNA(Pro) deacylase